MSEINEFPPRLTSPFIDGGRVQSIAAHPTNPNHIIFATQFGGLWKTEDGGTSWFHLAGLETVFAVDVGYAPDGATVIATLARDNAIDNGGGIWRSADAGFTWTKPATANPPVNARTPNRISGHALSSTLALQAT
jgi:photosystem II stability/assembly factor-like uncharacterized protein